MDNPPDRNQEFGKIVAAIDRYGIRNVSQLARVTRIPTETVRYKVSRQFRRFGLVVDMLIDERKLGLQKYFMEIEFQNGERINKKRFLDALHDHAYLFYAVKDLLTSKYLAYFLVPPTVQTKWLEFFEWLKKQKLIKDFTLSPYDWSRAPSVNARFLNFKSGIWAVDWNRLSKQDKKEPKEHEVQQLEKNPQRKYDTLDMLILKELQSDVTQALSEISEKLGINKKTLSYHYRNHVKQVMSGYRVRWLGLNSHKNSKEDVLAKLTFHGIDKRDLVRLRGVLGTLPFTTAEHISKGKVYSVDVFVPSGHLTASLRSLGEELEDMVPKMRMVLLDRKTETQYPISHTLFSDREGWYFDKRKTLDAISKSMTSLRKETGRNRAR